MLRSGQTGLVAAERYQNNNEDDMDEIQLRTS